MHGLLRKEGAPACLDTHKTNNNNNNNNATASNKSDTGVVKLKTPV